MEVMENVYKKANIYDLKNCVSGDEDGFVVLVDIGSSTSKSVFAAQATKLKE